MFYFNERTAVLIDGVSLHSTSRALGFEVDYKKLRLHFSECCRLSRLIYYTTIVESDEHASIKPLIDWLDYNGYCVKTKIAREFIDQAGGRKVKGSMSIEIAVDALVLAQHVDHIVLFTGDGEYRYLVEQLQRQGVRVTICSSHKTQPSMVSDDLRRQADSFMELNDMTELLAGKDLRKTT